MQHLVFGQLYFDLVWLIGDLQLGVKSFLGFFEPVSQLPPGLVELEIKDVVVKMIQFVQIKIILYFLIVLQSVPQSRTCLARLRASSRCLPRSNDL